MKKSILLFPEKFLFWKKVTLCNLTPDPSPAERGEIRLQISPLSRRGVGGEVMKMSKKKLLLFPLILAAIISFSWKETPKYQGVSFLKTKSIPDSGKIIYETYCLACHQEDGSGVPNMNPPLSQTDWVLGDSTRLINVILKGLKDTEINGDSYSNEMPSHDFLTDKQVAEVLTFVRSNFGNKASVIKEEDVRKVRAKK